MSKIFSIEGNFTQEGEWSQPDPSFKGKIIVEDDGSFSGYCNELYGSISSDKTRYLFGHLAQDEHGEVTGIAFFKLSNDHIQAPLIYLVADLKTDRIALWGSLSLSFGTLVTCAWHGEAAINVNTIETSRAGIISSISYICFFDSYSSSKSSLNSASVFS